MRTDEVRKIILEALERFIVAAKIERTVELEKFLEHYAVETENIGWEEYYGDDL